MFTGNIMIDIKQRVRYYMDLRKMNNNQLAIAADLNPSVISSLFTRSSEPEITTLASICKGLNVTLSEFFAEGTQYALTQKQQEILYLFDQLSYEKQELGILVLKAFID